MRSHRSELLELHPCFDMELFMTLSQESRVGGEVMERLERLWEAWLPELCALRLEIGDTGRQGYLLVSLSPRVEAAVDGAWLVSPSEGFRLNALAQTLCMAAVQEWLPEVADSGCAPAPALQNGWPKRSARQAYRTATRVPRWNGASPL